MATRTTIRPEPLEPRRLMSAAAPLANAQDVDLAYDGSGRLHLAFYDADARDLRYATRSPAGDWSDAAVIDGSSADVGAQLSLAVDAAGRPGIAYRDTANADLKYAHLGEGGAWVVRTVDGQRRADTGVSPSLAFDASNTPVISYYRPAGRTLRLATAARGRWHLRNVARVGGPAHAASSLAVDAESGTLGVAYERADGTVRYSRVGGRKVRTTVVDRLDAPGSRPSVAFDAGGHPVFSYYDVANGDVKLAFRTDAGWNVSIVADTDGQGAGSTLFVAPQALAVEVVYRDAGGAAAVASGSTDAATFQVRALPDSGPTDPVVAKDPTGKTLVTAYPGAAADVVSTLPGVSSLAALTVSTDTVRLGWTVSSGVEAKYEVQRSDDGGATFATVATLGAGATSAEITGLVEGRQYRVRVATCDGAGNRVESEPLSVSTLPQAAAGLAAAAISAGRVALTWGDNSNGEDGYRLERRSAGGGDDAPWNLLASLPPGATQFADETVAAGGRYEYRVVATLAGDRNPGTSAVTVSVPAPIPVSAPPVPVTLAAPGEPMVTRLSPTSAGLAWRDNASAETTYQVQWCVDGGRYKAYKTVRANTTSITVKGLSGGSTYRFRVRARGNSVDSSFATTAAYTVAPSAPTDLSAVAIGDGRKMDLLWKDPGNNRDAGFRIERSADGKRFVEVATVGEGVTRFVDAVPSASTVYRYRVQALGEWGATDYTPVVSEVGPDLSPTDVAVNVFSQTRIDVSWADNCPRETAYLVRYGDGVKSYELTRPAGSTAATLTGLTPGLDYTVQVVASLADGAEWASPQATAVMLVAPRNLSVRVGDADGGSLSSAVTLTWADPNGVEGGYVVERSIDGGATFDFLASVGSNSGSYTDADLPEDATYAYRVYAYNANGAGPLAAAVPNVPATWLHAPGGLTATPAGPRRIDLAWVDHSGAETHFKVAISVDGRVYYEIGTVRSTGPTSAAVTEDMFHQPLVAGATYWFKVMAVNATNASDWSQPAGATVGA